MATSLCNQEIIGRLRPADLLAFHEQRTLLSSCRTAEDMGKVVSLWFLRLINPDPGSGAASTSSPGADPAQHDHLKSPASQAAGPAQA